MTELAYISDQEVWTSPNYRPGRIQDSPAHRRFYINVPERGAAFPIDVPFGEDTSWVQPVAERITSLLKLEDNWNSYGAPVIDIWRTGTTLSLLSDLMRLGAPLPQIIPTNQGGLQLEWHLRGIDLELKIVSVSHFEMYFFQRSNAEEVELDLGADFTPLIRYIRRLQ